ncbi:MAG: hypothetical protein ACOYNL_05150 [Rickettsiales bacterium]
MQRMRVQLVLGLLVLSALAQAALAQPAPQAAPAAALAPAAVPAPATPTPAGIATAPVDEVAAPLIATPAPKEYSFGNSTISILFLPPQIERMKKTIRLYEDTDHGTEKPAVFVDVEELPVAEKLDEPANYPVFYLSSIVYNSAKDWSIWVAGYKITPHQNDTDVTVVSVRPDSVTFRWSPTYANVIDKRKDASAFAPTDAVINKVASAQPIEWDTKTGTLTFTLRQNQTLALGYYSVFEGFVASPPMPPMPAATPETAAAKSAPANNEAASSPAAHANKMPMVDLIKQAMPAPVATPAMLPAATPPAQQ